MRTHVLRFIFGKINLSLGHIQDTLLLYQTFKVGTFVALVALFIMREETPGVPELDGEQVLLLGDAADQTELAVEIINRNNRG